MTAAFEFAAPGRVVFGCGKLNDAGSFIKEWGHRGLLFTGQHKQRTDPLIHALGKVGISVSVISTNGEPTFQTVREFAAHAGSINPGFIIGMGGGSVIDTAKAVAMLMTNGGDPLDYAEVIGKGNPVTKQSAPFIAIPTTAGAGAEATRNAVLVERTRKAKVSLRSHLMLPRLVIIDPATTVSLSAKTTAATGMDALSQLIEPFVSVKANPVTDACCREGIRRAARSLERACTHPEDLGAREDMALAAWLSGMALANAGLGAVHGFAAALGGMCDAPHGLICAQFLAPVCRANISAINPEHPALKKYAEVAKLLTDRDDAAPEDGADWIANLAARLPLRPLNEFGIAKLPSDEIVDAALKSSSMKGNPEPLSREVLAAILASIVG
jgi:alcohol dehydrogenase class IV